MKPREERKPIRLSEVSDDSRHYLPADALSDAVKALESEEYDSALVVLSDEHGRGGYRYLMSMLSDEQAHFLLGRVKSHIMKRNEGDEEF